MRAYDLIRKKRDGGSLSADEISWIIGGHLKGDVPDYQMSAFLVTVCINGMDDAETVALTRAMLESGTTLDLSEISGTKVDKHSTGGVGDKTSIILAPLMAAMGLKIPMISGRGLGHTGGTLDKLESIPGLRTDIGTDEFKQNVKKIGFSIMGQTDEIAPADRKLYALRDVTATVESIPLIAASIMSKKLAEGTEGLVLDVKCGSGAFMKTEEKAKELAQVMVKIGDSMGVRTVAVVTEMSEPLGRAVGNSLEVKECLNALKGNWAADLKEVTMTLGAWMLTMSDSLIEETSLQFLDPRAKKHYIDEALDFIEKGDAFKKFTEFVDAQYGDAETLFKPAMLPSAKETKHILAKGDGYLRTLDAEAVGRAAVLLGAGRERMGDEIDPAAGIVLTKKTGDEVKAGEPLAMFHYGDMASLAEAEDAFYSGVEIGPKEPVRKKLMRDVVMPPKK